VLGKIVRCGILTAPKYRCQAWKPGAWRWSSRTCYCSRSKNKSWGNSPASCPRNHWLRMWVESPWCLIPALAPRVHFKEQKNMHTKLHARMNAFRALCQTMEQVLYLQCTVCHLANLLGLPVAWPTFIPLTIFPYWQNNK